jgi:release factor glutamine methyltransferase
VPGSPDHRLDALVVRLRRAGCVFAEEEAALLLEDAPSDAVLEVRAARRCAGEPLEQVLGWAAFAGLRVAVAPGVFVPRRRSELLAREAAARAARAQEGALARGRRAVVVDLCCGSGALALVVAAAVPGAEVHAADLDPAATACAAHNLRGLAAAGGDGRVHTGDLFDALPHDLRGRVDVLVVNAPYVPRDDVALMPPEARDHEPLLALDGGGDGLDVHRRVAAGAREWLSPGGALLVETSARQAEGTEDACRAGGLVPSTVHDPALEAAVVVALA